MRLNILADAEWDSGVGCVLDWLSTTEYWTLFQKRSYGAGLDGVSIFLICRNPEYGFKRRIRHSKKEKKIYIDVMLDLNEIATTTPAERRFKILSKLRLEVPEVIGRYKIDGFNSRLFLSDFEEKFSELSFH
ncbi:hypothetical protein [Pseudoduganella violaceinigra]|uniref:hypothetical protein n=1 Tax=Pseudoduganella violaceinigra TaxID=246602 RepID=UPI0012B60EC7|nr:hypothetical protein [Pseudoduganella violaceinigra]